jgi:hypothetical protein
MDPTTQLPDPRSYYIRDADGGLPVAGPDYYLNRLPQRGWRVTFEVSCEKRTGLAR